MSDDSLLASLNVSGSGLSAERTRLNIIANNMANINTTRTAEGGSYRRRQVVFETVLADATEQLDSSMEGNLGKGVRVSEIVKDQTPFKKVYDPKHPDADEAGYVSLPNVNISEEMVDLISASRAYEANVAVIKATKSMLNKSLEIGRR